MKAIGTKLNLKKLNNTLINISSKNLHKSIRPTFYNLRLYMSNMRRAELAYNKWDIGYGPEGFEKVYT